MTAVEWLESKFSEFETIYDSLPTRLYEYIEQAKEMEKQQMIDFANDLLARNNKNYIALPDLAEEYYNENFKKQIRLTGKLKTE